MEIEGFTVQLNTIKTTTIMLEQWVVWSFQNVRISLNYPSQIPTEIFKENKKKKKNFVILNDNEAGKIDAIVANLKKRDQEMGDALILYFFSKENISFVARQLKISREKARILVNAAICWIDGVIAANAITF